MVFSMVSLGLLCLFLSMLVIPGFREAVLQPAVDILIDADLYKTKIIGE
jgi:hypothetical protein